MVTWIMWVVNFIENCIVSLGAVVIIATIDTGMKPCWIEWIVLIAAMVVVMSWIV